MQRVVVLGRGASGKSVLAARLGELTRTPVVELDKIFWRADLTPTPPEQWSARQQDLAGCPAWIADGDLGPYDVLDVRLSAADTVVLLDFSLLRCTWRAMRRSRARADFWRWVLTYRCRWRPRILRAIRVHAPTAQVIVLRNPRSVDQFLAQVVRYPRAESPHPEDWTARGS